MKQYIDEIMKLAHKSLKSGDIPVGAIVVKNNRIIGKGYNTREKDKNILGHAEINAIKNAIKAENTWKLSDCDIYVTLKPCNMCLEIIKQARIKNIYYLLDKLDYKKEFNKTNIHNINNNNIEKEYMKLINSFFSNLREK